MNHSSIPQIHLNGGENSLSGGEHSIRIYSPASASSSASSFLLLSKALIGRRREKKKRKSRKTAAPATGAPSERPPQSFGRTRNLSRIRSPGRKVSRDLLSFQKKKESLGTLTHPSVWNITSFFVLDAIVFLFFRLEPSCTRSERVASPPCSLIESIAAGRHPKCCC